MNRATRARIVQNAAGALIVTALVGACGAAIQAPSASQGLPTIGPAATTSAPVVTPTPTLAPSPSPTPSPTPKPSLHSVTGVAAANTCDPSVVPGSAFAPFTPGPPPKAKSSALHVPILEYHRIVPIKEAGRSLPHLTMPPEIFAAQMSALDKAGWKTITLATLANDLAAGVAPPAQTFVVTIDDGWWDGYTYAYPILAQHGFVATFFVIAGRIGNGSFLGPSQIQALAAAGNEIGDHSVHHGWLTALNPKALTSEIDSAAATIAAVTGVWPETLAYPHGATDTQVMAAVAACKPLRMAVVEGHGGTETWANRYDIARFEIGPHVTGAGLLAEVRSVGH